MEIKIYENERIDDLQSKGLKIIQSKDQFAFSTDAVLISDFSKVKRIEKVLDIGTGNGVIPLLIYSRYSPKEITAIEIQEVLADRAKRNMALNNLHDKINVILGDINNYKELFENQAFDVIVSNPPYRKVGHGEMNENINYRIAKHEVALNLEGLMKAVKYLLKDRGKFYFIHRADRIGEIISELRINRLEPKNIRFVYSKPGVNAHLVMVEAVKNSNPDVKILPPLYLYDNDGNISEEINQIYNNY